MKKKVVKTKTVSKKTVENKNNKGVKKVIKNTNTIKAKTIIKPTIECLFCKRESAENVDFFRVYKFNEKNDNFICLGCLTGHFRKYIVPRTNPMAPPINRNPSTGNTNSGVPPAGNPFQK